MARYGKPCKHAHVSGRRCAERVSTGTDPSLCVLHKRGACTECDSMKAAFTPPKGWNDGPF